MRYQVVMVHPDGGRTVLDKTRRLKGAVNIMFAHEESKREQFTKKLQPGERVVSGPDPSDPRDVSRICEQAAVAVVLIGPNIEVKYRYVVETTDPSYYR